MSIDSAQQYKEIDCIRLLYNRVRSFLDNNVLHVLSSCSMSCNAKRFDYSSGPGPKMTAKKAYIFYRNFFKK